jgi:hypothetical protein
MSGKFLSRRNRLNLLRNAGLRWRNDYTRLAFHNGETTRGRGRSC